MKTIARQISVIAVLVLWLTVFSGAPEVVARTGYAEPAYDMIVVQSSIDRKLSPADLDQLHDAVARFLAGEGPVLAGEYVVRIDFPPSRPGAAPEWVIVKLTNLPPPAFALAGDDTTGESAYGYGYDSGYAYSPYGYYDPFDPYFNGYYWSQVGGPFGGNRHWRIDRDDHDRVRDERGGESRRPDYRDRAGERRPVDMSKRPRVTYTRIDGQSGAQRSGERDDPARSQRSRNGTEVGHEHRVQAADNLPRFTDASRLQNTGAVDHPPQLSGDRPGRNSFAPPPPPPVRNQTAPPASNNQKDRDTGSRRPEP